MEAPAGASASPKGTFTVPHDSPSLNATSWSAKFTPSTAFSAPLFKYRLDDHERHTV